MPNKITKQKEEHVWKCALCGQEYGMYIIAAECESTHTMKGAYEIGQVYNNGWDTIVDIRYKQNTYISEK